MTNAIPPSLANTVVLSEHDEALQKQVVNAVEKIVTQYLNRNLHLFGADILSVHQSTIERLALRALKNHFNNASNIY